MISKDDVVSGYRLLLGREPENASVVSEAASIYNNLAELRAALMGSEEFLQNSTEFIMRNRFPLDLEVGSPASIHCSDSELFELLSRVERTWDMLGKEEPYWSVLTLPSFKTNQFEQNQEIFWQSGSYDVARFKSWLARNGVTFNREWGCLEYGCGTGRITRWLAKEFRSVAACDISSSHLALARQAMPTLLTACVSYHQISTMQQLAELPQFDLLFSIIVLQHNPPPIIACILKTLLTSLKPGGLAYFQVPTFIRDYAFDSREYLRDRSSGAKMEMHCLPQQHIFEIARDRKCFPLEVQPDNMAGLTDTVSTTFLFRKSEE